MKPFIIRTIVKLSAVLLFAGVAGAEAPSKGHAVIGAINPSAGTVMLHGERFMTTYQTELLDEGGSAITLREFDAIDEPIPGRPPNPDTGDKVYYEASATGSPRTLLKLRRVKIMPN